MEGKRVRGLLLKKVKKEEVCFAATQEKGENERFRSEQSRDGVMLKARIGKISLRGKKPQ